MDKLLDYKAILKEVLTDYAQRGATSPDSKEQIETQLLFDDTHAHYQVLRVGWEQMKNTFLVIFHFDIKDNKIWVQRNISDYDIIGDLEAKGVPKQDIVLAFYSPRMRAYTEYAAA